MGGKIVGGAFAASVKTFVQHGRVSSKYFGECHSWPSHLQADLAAACLRYTNLGTGGRLTFAVSLLKHATVSREFSALPKAPGTVYVKLPIEESVVKVLPSASSTILFVLRAA